MQSSRSRSSPENEISEQAQVLSEAEAELDNLTLLYHRSSYSYYDLELLIPAAATRLRNVPLDLLTIRDQRDRYIRNRPHV